jgi:hypothetical protein
VLVLEISVHVVNGETEYCHFVTLPVFPLKVSTPLLLPEHISVPPATAPPIDDGFTITVAVVEFDDVHTPLVTTAR